MKLPSKRLHRTVVLFGIVVLFAAEVMAWPKKRVPGVTRISEFPRRSTGHVFTREADGQLYERVGIERFEFYSEDHDTLLFYSDTLIPTSSELGLKPKPIHSQDQIYVFKNDLYVSEIGPLIRVKTSAPIPESATIEALTATFGPPLFRFARMLTGRSRQESSQTIFFLKAGDDYLLVRVDSIGAVAGVRQLSLGTDPSKAWHTTRIIEFADDVPFWTPRFEPEYHFDIVSEIGLPEVLKVIRQAAKELRTRLDLKNSNSAIDLNEKEKKIVVRSQDEFSLKAVLQILEEGLVSRKVPLKGLHYGKTQQAAAASVVQEITIQQGIPIEKARDIVKEIKNTRLNVEASIEGDQVRVSGEKGEDLIAVTAMLRQKEFGMDWKIKNLYLPVLARKR